uniref:GPI ethanolamine phosphate transferase 2 C-terminal domain-containing protein n=1 Tax=Megaselia scalaris TaxID=36166 RepID=T1GVA5_MEGSC
MISNLTKNQTHGHKLKLFTICGIISLVLYFFLKAIGLNLSQQLLISFGISFSILQLWKQQSFLKTIKLNNLFILLGSATLFQTLSFSSSSFIEEEHQTWYYFGSTLLLGAFLCSRKISTVHKVEWIFIISLNIFCRRLNQTGDKWINIPDIGDWLNLEENKIYEALICGFGILLLTIICFQKDQQIQTVLQILCSLAVLNYRFPFLEFISPKISVYSAFLCIALMTFQRKSLLSPMSFFCILLHKPHNIILVPLEIITLRKIYKFCDLKFEGRNSLISKTVFTFWMSKMYFFYQGNSNNFATIDVNAGFVGVEQFNLILAGLFTIINTFSSQIISILVIFEELSKQHKDQFLKSSFKIQSILVSAPLTLYLILMIIFKNHIFIWTN